MTRRRTVSVGLAGVLVAGAAWIGFGTAAADDGQSGVEVWSGRAVDSVAQARQQAAQAGLTGRSIAVVGEDVRDRLVDLPPDDFSPGDFFLFEQKLYDATRRSKLVGRDAVRCEFGIRTFTCEGTMWLRGRGKIRIAGTSFGPEGDLYPITGGTGRFKDVGGQLMVFSQRGDDLLLFEVLHLRP